LRSGKNRQIATSGRLHTPPDFAERQMN